MVLIVSDMVKFDANVNRCRDKRGRFAKCPEGVWRAIVRFRFQDTRDYDTITLEFTGDLPTDEESFDLVRSVLGENVIPFAVVSLEYTA